MKKILESYEKLREAEKEELAAEIIRPSLQLYVPAMSDADFVSNADEVFLELDQCEAKDRHA